MSASFINIPNRRILNKHFVEQMIGEPVKDYAISVGNKPGDNIMGTLLSLDVKTVSNDIYHLIIKSVLPMTGVIDRNILSNSKLIAELKRFPREIIYYKQIRPIFQEIFKEDSIGSAFYTHPKNYSCLHDKERLGLDDYIVLENLKPFGYKMMDKFKGLNYEEMTASLKGLALLHATSYCILNGTGKPTDDLHVILNDPTCIINTHGWDKHQIEGSSFEEFFNNIVSKMIDLVKEDGQVEIAQKICNIARNGHSEILMGLWNKTTEQGKYFRVFIHGDLWTNNILIKHGPDGKSVEDVKFIDFQMSRFGNIYEDLHYFIFTSTTSASRKAHLNDYLQTYYLEFKKVLQELGYHSPPSGFTQEQLISNFHETLNYGFVYNLLAIPFQLGMTPPPPSPMTPIEVNFKGKSGNQFFSSMKILSNEGEDSTEQNEMTKPDFREMMDSAVVGLQFSARSSPVALQRVHEMIEEMIDLGLIH